MPQGKLHVRTVARSGAINALVVPEDDPQDWYFQPFPTREIMEAYAKEYDLEIVELEEEQDADNG